MKPASKFLKQASKPMIVALLMLASACAPVLTSGDAALCGPEFKGAMKAHNLALVMGPITDEQAETGDKVMSMYDAGCRG
jgi:hypothetical protein